MKPRSKSRPRKFLRTLLKLSGSLLIALLLFELALHIFPIAQTDYHSSFQYIGDKELGYHPLPNQDATYNIACLRNPHLKTNSLGFRGPEWQGKSSPKVALLGDSFMLALTVSDKLHVATLLQSALGGEVWNAGTSGYGTYQELLAWRKLIKPLQPDVTVVFVNLENDLRDNHCGLCRAENQRYSPCLSIQAGQVKEEKDFELRKPVTGVKAWLNENCYTYRLLRKLRSPDHAKAATGYYFDLESFAYNVYRPHHSPKWDEAWQVTDWSLRLLKQECDAIGSKLLLVNVPGTIQLAHDLPKAIMAQIGTDSLPPDLDLGMPIRRLQTIADSAAIPLLDLQPAFIAYRDRHQVPDPVFTWCCDGHWNPLGHRLAADLLNNHLVQAGWVTGKMRETGPPVEILGAQMMDEIYQCQTVHLD